MSGVENLWLKNKAKAVGKGGLGAASVGVSAAQYALGQPGYYALAAGAAAASATGIGLIVTGAVLTVTTCALSGKASYSSHQHAKALEIIKGKSKDYACAHLGDGRRNDLEHNYVGDDVLAYIIKQKEEKAVRKGVGAVPVIGSSTTAYSMGRWMYKKWKGTLGGVRHAMAWDLTRHFLTHDCALAQAIVAELFTHETMLQLMHMEAEAAEELLARKMASN